MITTTSNPQYKKLSPNIAPIMNQLFLPREVIEQVMEFLDPRSLFNLAFLSKETQGCLSHSMVIKCALFHGGYAKKNMESVVELVKSGSIHPPSPQRCLRLCNGSRCESCLNKTNVIRPGYGMFFCWHCCTKRQMSKAFVKNCDIFNRNQREINSILDHPRVKTKRYAWRSITGGHDAVRRELRRARKMGIKARWSSDWYTFERQFEVNDMRNYLWKRARTDNLGEKVGTIVTFEEVSKILKYMKAQIRALKPKGIGPSSEMDKELISEYLQETLYAAPTDCKWYSDIIHVYDENIEDATLHIQDMKWTKETKSNNWKAKKLENCIKMVESLKCLIANPRIHRVLNYVVVPLFFTLANNYSNQHSIKFRHAWVQALLKKYILHPSKMTKKMKKQMVKCIEEEYKNRAIEAIHV